MTEQNNELSFKISTGLKNIIGRDLISDKYIAIFELVKNSYDAGASKVDISLPPHIGNHTAPTRKSRHRRFLRPF